MQHPFMHTLLPRRSAIFVHWAPALLGLLLALLLLPGTASAQPASIAMTAGDSLTAAPLQDTLYLLDSTLIEIDLDRQELYLHRTGGRIDTFLCSTGDPKLSGGIATRPGIFTIDAKKPSHRSSQFDVAMFYWMPFDGGIGMHALEGTGYYNLLGYAPSSHGCVRLSRETAEDLYAHIPVGTRVFVHEGIPARVLRLADGVRDIRTISRRDIKLLRRRLAAAVAGRRDDPALREKLALPATGGGMRRIEVGSLRGGETR